MRLNFAISLLLALLASPPAQAQGEAAPAALTDQEWSVTVDGETKTWKAFESGTDRAWNAYLGGDYVNAVPAFQRLAEMGHPVALWLMGMIYYRGQGVAMDMGRAFASFRAAAEQGYFRAFAPLAAMYETGEGTAADPGLAYTWYNIATARLPESRERSDLVRLREKVAATMSPAQIEAAQKRANRFVPKPVIPPDPGDLAIEEQQ